MKNKKNKKSFIIVSIFLIVFSYVYYLYASSTPVKAIESFRSGFYKNVTVIAYEEFENGILVYSEGNTGMKNDNFYCVDFVKRSPIIYKWVGGGGHNHKDIGKGIGSESYILSAQVLNENQNIKPTIFGIIKDATITGIKIYGDMEGEYDGKIFKGLDDERIYVVNFDEEIEDTKIYKMLIKRNDGTEKEILIVPGEEDLEKFNEGKDILYYRSKGPEIYGMGIEKDIAKKIGKVFRLDEKVLSSIKSIDDEKYLISYFETGDPIINPLCFIYDINTNQYIPVEYFDDYVESITVENGVATFHSKGINVFNGFKKFPIDFVLDIETGKPINKDIYKSLSNYDEKVSMGNYFNETKLNNLKVQGNTIVFDFGISGGSILAGGYFCPNIITKPVEDGKLSVAIENLKYDESQLKEYSHKETIEGDHGKYTEIIFEISNYNYYNVKFETKLEEEYDDVMDMKIILK